MSKLPISQRSMQEYAGTSYLSAQNAAYVEDLYEEFLQDPQSVADSWREYFSSLDGASSLPAISHSALREELRQAAQRPVGVVDTNPPLINDKQGYVDSLITAYRRFGHISANINPLHAPDSSDSRLQLSHHQLHESDLDAEFLTGGILPVERASLREIVASLQSIYCGSVGVEYDRITDDEERKWLRDYIEHRIPRMQLSAEERRSIMRKLVAAEGLEHYLDKKYTGQKRFSVEGLDTIIPMLDELAKRSRPHHIEEIVIGMAHRGRINVLINIMGKSPKELFAEFDGTKDLGNTSGDVKYHNGFSSDVQTSAGPMHLSLAFNPSHLEFIAPVIMGSVRARQERNNGKGDLPKANYAMAVSIHGDASFAGQGVVLETLNMSQTNAYHIGGTIHIILNNQVGFTTSDPRDARSSRYCSDPAKIIDAPVFHVNADDPEAAVKVMQLAVDYRMEFKKDIVIDLVGFRRHGHQEVDEPRATQPMMYHVIAKHPGVKTLYARQLVEEKVCEEKEVDQWLQEYRDRLDQGREVVEVIPEGLAHHYAANWTPYIGQNWRAQVDTAVPHEKLKQLAERLLDIPQHFELLRGIDKIMQGRRSMLQGEQPMDWGFAENLAYATLLDQGVPIRFSGEDCCRGTFYHRQAVLHDQKTGETYMPLQHVRKDQAPIQLYDSLLSETGAMGFEYGYATADPKALVIWEAQFGDFANVAQVIIDQFLSSAWQKWGRLSGITLLLPHGYEGQGPEHSSARLERFLQLSAEDNIQVCVPTSPAQIFHLLRRQAIRPYRKPLVVMSPKSLLRHKLAVSTYDDLTKGAFQLLIPEVDEIAADKVTRAVLCAGKVFYEVLQKRRDESIDNIAIIRLEQLYPFPYQELTRELQRYPNLKQVVWCQEEPKNQGAWFILHDRLQQCMPSGCELFYAGRQRNAAPACGYPKLHNTQQQALVAQALDLVELSNDQGDDA